MKTFLILASATLCLVACSDPGEPAGPALTPVPQTSPSSAETPVPEASEVTVVDEMCGAVTFDGFCGVSFGMTGSEARDAFEGDALELGIIDEADPIDTACYFLNEPSKDRRYSFMVEDNTVQSVYVRDPAILTSDGAHVGMTRDKLVAVYPDARMAPNKYTEFENLIVDGEDGAKIVFEFLSDETAYIFRTGIKPGIDYVEGCSL